MSYPKHVYHLVYHLDNTNYKIVETAEEERSLGPEYFKGHTGPKDASDVFNAMPLPKQLEVVSRSKHPAVATLMARQFF